MEECLDHHVFSVHQCAYTRYSNDALFFYESEFVETLSGAQVTVFYDLVVLDHDHVHDPVSDFFGEDYADFSFLASKRNLLSPGLMQGEVLR